MLFLHQLLPLEEAENSDDDIKGVEAGFEGNVLVEVEDAGDDIKAQMPTRLKAVVKLSAKGTLLLVNVTSSQ